MEPQATLFIVGTPLGNLGDVSARLAACLRAVTVVYAEDTRRSRILLNHLGIDKPLRSLHGHNESHRTAEVLKVLQRGDSVALLTDAGTPVISDPGSEVVAAAHAAGLRVSPVAGPSALTAALSVAGFFSHDVRFVGFLPTRGKDLRAALSQVVNHRGSVVLFESPHRLPATLQALAAAQPDREVCVCRELTKLHEEVLRRPAADMAAWAAGKEILGEITVVVGPQGAASVPSSPEQVVVDAAIKRCLLAGLSSRDTATAVAAVLQLKRREVYARCQELAGSS